MYSSWDHDYGKSLDFLHQQTAKALEESKRLEACPLPDPKNIKDLNAYLSLWADEKEVSLEECVSNCQKAEKISRQIVELLCDAKCEEDTKLVQWCVEYLDKLRGLSKRKINNITLYTLENIEKYLLRTKEERDAIINKSTIDTNAHTIEGGEKKDEDPTYKTERLYKHVLEDVTVGMYMNRNNRQYKPLPVEFEDVRGQVEMPRSLSPANAPPEVMIRSIWTSFNDFSNEVFTPLIPVGGVVVFDLYKFGELFPAEVKGWTVRQVFDPEKTLASIPYPDPKCIVFAQLVSAADWTDCASAAGADKDAGICVHRRQRPAEGGAVGLCTRFALIQRYRRGNRGRPRASKMCASRRSGDISSSEPLSSPRWPS